MLLQAGLEAGDSSDMSGEVAESLLLHKHREEIPSQIASNRDFFFFPHHSFLFVTQSELTTCDSLSQAGELMEVPVSLISMPQ